VGLPDEEREYSLSEPVLKRRELSPEGNYYIRTCPECYMVFPTAPVCPFCGTKYPLSPREIQAQKDIELARITAEEAERVAEAKKKSRIEQGRAASFEELVKLGKQRGYKNPAFWAAQVMIGRKR
jgi:flagellar biosynthesis/type III secretory pathway protein FliH